MNSYRFDTFKILLDFILEAIEEFKWHILI